MELKEMIFALCAEAGPSGFEDTVVARAEVLLRPLVDELYRDTMGNLIAVRHAKKAAAKKLLLDAHIDEVGLIITGHAEGFLKFSTLGGIDPRVLPAAEVKLLTEPPLYGVLSTMPPHVLSAEDMDKTSKPEDLVIDAGLCPEDAAAIPPGTAAVFTTLPAELAGECICAKALDDRLCFAVLLRALVLLGETRPDVELYITASVQEELGMRGAKTAAYGVEPDYCLVLDVTHAATADNGGEDKLRLGGGVAIDLGPGISKPVSALLKRLAREENIPHQIEVEAGNPGTNSWPIQISRGGVLTGLLSVPLRYMHSPVETASLADAEAAAKLVCAFVRALGMEAL